MASILKVDTIQGATSANAVAMPAGHVIQTAQALKTDVFSTSSTSFVDVRNGVIFNFYGTTKKLDLGLYLSKDGSSCAYQVVKQQGNKVVIIFRQNPTTSTPATCATGMDYPISVDVLDSRTFVDLRNDKTFVYFSRH